MAIDYSLALLLATLLTGGVVLYDKVYLKAKAQLQEGEKLPPGLLDFCYTFFPILVIIFTVRSFMYEPFRIPSGSMRPTLEVGDFILVEKFRYGLVFPGFSEPFLDWDKPRRGDVIVFRYPLDHSEFYIKRIIGLPGDRIHLEGRKITIFPGCGIEQANCRGEIANQFPTDRSVHGTLTEQYNLKAHRELLDGHEYRIYFDRRTKAQSVIEQYQVPEGQYFVMGDNRDQSNDSRYWGFVAEDELIGRAVAVWMHIDFEHPTLGWLPTSIRFSDARGIH